MRRYLTRFLVFLLMLGLGISLAMLWQVMASPLTSLIPTQTQARGESDLSLPLVPHDPCKNAGCFKESSVVVTIPNDHEIYIGTEKVTLKEVTNELSIKLKYKCERLVFVKSSDFVKFRTLYSVIEQIRKTRVDGIGLRSNQRIAKTR